MEAYTKERQIGKGAFGCAWLVKSKNGGTLVAKEVCMLGMSKADRAVAQQEASVLRSLNHPSIIGMYEDFIEGDNLVIIMEYAGGGDLDKVLTVGWSAIAHRCGHSLSFWSPFEAKASDELCHDRCSKQQRGSILPNP